jgi:MFS transporter, DHA1 family, inner membrane transport protein
MAVDVRLVWVAVGGFAVNVEVFSFAGLLPGMAADTGVAISQAGYLASAYAVSFAIGAPLLTSIFASSDRRRVLAIAAAVFSALTLIAALSTGYWQLFATRMALGFTAGLFGPLALATAAALSTPEGRGRAVSTVISGQTAAIALGVPLAALIATRFGWRVSYLSLTAIGAAAAVALWVMLPTGIRGVRLTIRERLSALAIPGVPLSYVVTVLFLIGGFSQFFYLGPLTTKFLGLETWWIPLALLGYGLGAAVGNLIGGRLNDRLGSTRVIVLGIGATAVLLPLLTIIPNLPRLAVGPAWWSFQFMTAFTAWAYYAGQVSRLAAFRPSAAPLILSLNGTANNIGSATAAVIGGVVLDWLGLGAIGPVAALFALAALLLVLAMEFNRRRSTVDRRDRIDG